MSEFARERASEAIDRAAAELQTVLSRCLGPKAKALDLLSGVAGLRDKALKALVAEEKPKK